MESSNSSCNVTRIIALLSLGDETTHRNDETTNDDEPMWSVMSRTRKTTSRRGQPTNRTVTSRRDDLTKLYTMTQDGGSKTFLLFTQATQ